MKVTISCNNDREYREFLKHITERYSITDKGRPHRIAPGSNEYKTKFVIEKII